jgi:hypothetical protein
MVPAFVEVRVIFCHVTNTACEVVELGRRSMAIVMFRIEHPGIAGIGMAKAQNLSMNGGLGSSSLDVAVDVVPSTVYRFGREQADGFVRER